jgi:hypothetical protein
MSNFKYTVPLEFQQPTKPRFNVIGLIDADVATVGEYQPEITLTMENDQESFDRMFPPIAYYVLDKRITTRSVSETFYGEEVDEQGALTEVPPLMIPIEIKISPPLQYLRKFGIEELQDAIALLSIGWLQANLPNFNPKIGDRILYHQIEFRVETVKFSDYFANEQVPIHYLLTLDNMSESKG